jgi:superfamily II DNA or RNA helicase
VQMPAKLQKAYSEMERLYWMQLEGQSYRTKHAVAKYSMLRKLASGILDDAVISEHKIEELTYLLNNEFADEQVIIWCNHLVEGKYVACKLDIPFVYGEMPLQKREVHFGEFVSGKLQQIIIQPETQKFGRNLSNADVNIFLSSPTSSMTREQSQSRFISIDKMRTLYTIDIVAEGTVDHDIAKAHIKNKNAEKEMFNAIRLRNNRSGNKRGNSSLAR